MTEKIIEWLEGRSERAITFMGIVLVFACGVIDVKTGKEIHLLYFYLIPVLLVSWFVNGKVGAWVAVLSVVTSVVADRVGGYGYSSIWLAFGDLVLRTGPLIFIGVALSRLRAEFQSVAELANRDFLTGLPNGRAFYSRAAREIDRAFGLEPLALACFDIEGFRWINHRYGYDSGDQILCTIAQTIRNHAPRPELVGRIGGTAFAVLLPNTDGEGASFIVERIRMALLEQRRSHAHPLTFYVSAIACTKAPRSVAELMHEVESRLRRMRGSNEDTVEIAKVDSVPALN